MQKKLIMVATFFTLLLLYSCDRNNQIELVEVVDDGVTIRSDSEKFPEFKILEGLFSRRDDGTWSMGAGSNQTSNNSVITVSWDMDEIATGEYSVNRLYIGTYGTEESFPTELRCCKTEGTGFTIDIKQIDQENKRVIGNIQGKGELLYFNENEESNFEIISLEGAFNAILRDSIYPSTNIAPGDISESLKLTVSNGEAEVTEINGGYLISCYSEPAQSNQDTVFHVGWRTSELGTGAFDLNSFDISTFDEAGLPSFISPVEMTLNVEQFGAIGERVSGTVSGIASKNGIASPPLPPGPTMEPVEVELKFSFLRVK